MDRCVVVVVVGCVCCGVVLMLAVFVACVEDYLSSVAF
jgi:hypothetical protein